MLQGPQFAYLNLMKLLHHFCGLFLARKPLLSSLLPFRVKVVRHFCGLFFARAPLLCLSPPASRKSCAPLLWPLCTRPPSLSVSLPALGVKLLRHFCGLFFARTPSLSPPASRETAAPLLWPLCSTPPSLSVSLPALRVKLLCHFCGLFIARTPLLARFSLSPQLPTARPTSLLLSPNEEVAVHGPVISRLAGLAFLLSVGILLQILGCALYNNWWPMLTVLMYILVPMPCLFFGNTSSSDFISVNGGDDWADAAKFLTGFSAVGSIAIPAILRHAQLIESGAMWIEFASFFVVLVTVMLFQHVSQEEEYY